MYIQMIQIRVFIYILQKHTERKRIIINGAVDTEKERKNKINKIKFII